MERIAKPNRQVQTPRVQTPREVQRELFIRLNGHSSDGTPPSQHSRHETGRVERQKEENASVEWRQEHRRKIGLDRS